MGIEIRHELLGSPEIRRQHGAGILSFELLFTAHMLDHTDEWRRVETRLPGGRLRQRHVVSRRLCAMQTQERAEDDHKRVQTRGQKLELPLSIVSRRQNTLPQLDLLAHRFLLELQTQVAGFHGYAIEWRIAKQHAMSLENVGVLHWENVR